MAPETSYWATEINLETIRIIPQLLDQQRRLPSLFREWTILCERITLSYSILQRMLSGHSSVPPCLKFVLNPTLWTQPMETEGRK